MSDFVTALAGAVFTDGIAEIRELPHQGMITLRGDLSDARIQAAVSKASGTQIPAQRLIARAGDLALCWMSSDELLLLCPHEAVAQNVQKMQDGLGDMHALCVDVSDARAVFDVSGPNAREVLAKLAPVDMAPAAFKPGMVRRTRLAQVPAAFWLQEADRFRIICFRSHARYVFDLLCTAAAPGGRVGVF